MDFSISNEIVESSESLFERSVVIKAVELIQIDKVRLQSLQASFHSSNNVLSAQSFIVHSRARFEENFCRNDKVFSPFGAQPS
jgi:hypothetical protein